MKTTNHLEISDDRAKMYFRDRMDMSFGAFDSIVELMEFVCDESGKGFIHSNYITSKNELEPKGLNKLCTKTSVYIKDEFVMKFDDYISLYDIIYYLTRFSVGAKDDFDGDIVLGDSEIVDDVLNVFKDRFSFALGIGSPLMPNEPVPF